MKPKTELLWSKRFLSLSYNSLQDGCPRDRYQLSVQRVIREKSLKTYVIRDLKENRRDLWLGPP